MKQLNSALKTKQIILLVMLSLMLISTSCTVRNFLQDHFNFTQTSVTNLSKYTVRHQANCLDFKEQVATSQDQTNSIAITQAAVLFLVSFFFESNSHEKSLDYTSTDTWNIKSVPFYLLYQNLKLLD